MVRWLGGHQHDFTHDTTLYRVYAGASLSACALCLAPLHTWKLCRSSRAPRNRANSTLRCDRCALPRAVSCVRGAVYAQDLQRASQAIDVFAPVEMAYVSSTPEAPSSKEMLCSNQCPRQQHKAR